MALVLQRPYHNVVVMHLTQSFHSNLWRFFGSEEDLRCEAILLTRFRVLFSIEGELGTEL